MRMAECHTDMKYYANGLCRKCYRAIMNEKHNGIYKKRKANFHHNFNAEKVYRKKPISDIPDMNKDSYWLDQDCKLPKLITI